MSKTAPVSEGASNRAINGGCVRVRTAGKRFNDTVQEVGLMVLSHFGAFNDCNGAARLLASMPSNVKGGALRDWFRIYGGINLGVKDGKPHANRFKEGSPNYKARVDMDGARANPWNTLAKPAKDTAGLYTVEDLSESIERLVTRITNMVERTEKNEGDGQRVNAGDIPALKAKLDALKALAKVETETDGNDNSSSVLPVSLAA